MERVRSHALIARRLALLASFGLWCLVPAKFFGADRTFGSALSSSVVLVFLLATLVAGFYAAHLGRAGAEEARSLGRLPLISALVLNFVVQGALATGFVGLVEWAF